MKNFFATLPNNLDEEVFEPLIKHDTIKIERIISKGHTSPQTGWHEQLSHEWVMVLKGEARLAFENKPEVHLKVGDYINIPACTRHRVSWTPEDQTTIWLAIHYQ